MGIPQHPAERAALVLVDVAGATPPSIFREIVVPSAALVQLTAEVYRDRALAVLERPDRAEINGACEAHARNARIGSLVDDHGRHELRRILVELHCSVESRARLLPTIQQDSRKVWRKTTDRDDLRTARYALSGDTRESRDGFGNRHVGQLADFLR